MQISEEGLPETAVKARKRPFMTEVSKSQNFFPIFLAPLVKPELK